MSGRLRLTALIGPPACVLGVVAYCCYPVLIGLAGGMEAAERSGRRDIPFAAEFDQLYPGTVHFISYYTGTYGPTTWHSQVGLYGRYVLSVECPITLDVTRTRVAGYGRPTFRLNEVVRAQPTAGGGWAVEYGEQRTFGAAEWGRVVAASGDFGVLGVVLRMGAPVRHFNAVWKAP
jgi:hypothetical protein